MSHSNNNARTLFNPRCFVRWLSLTAFLSVLASAPLLAKQPPPDPAVANTDLIPTKVDFFDDFALLKGAKLSGFSDVYISDPSVTFKKNWRKDHLTTTSSNYQEKIAKRYATLLKKQLTKVFTEDARYSVASASSERRLVIEAHITDLDIYAPDSLALVKQYVFQAGKAKLTVNLKDNSGNVLATVSDSRETREVDIHTPQRTNSLLNERDFRILMTKWAKQLADLIAKH